MIISDLDNQTAAMEWKQYNVFKYRCNVLLTYFHHLDFYDREKHYDSKSVIVITIASSVMQNSYASA